MWEQYEPQRDCVFCLDDIQGYKLGTLVEVNGVDFIVVHIQPIDGGWFKIYLTPAEMKTE